MPPSVIERVSRILGQCSSDSTVLRPTELYNEGWMLRLVLDWFDRNRDIPHKLAFLPDVRWYPEALLPSPFLAEIRGDPRAESFTNADGAIGHFSIQPGRAEAIVLPDARQLVIVEAKLGSRLSSRVKNARNYDQAARTVACMAEMLNRKKIDPQSLDKLGFYVVAPHDQIKAGVFGELVTKRSIRGKVVKRIARYEGTRDTWFQESFEPLLEHIDLDLLSWESVLEHIESSEPQAALQKFYALCLRFNLNRPERGT